MVAKELGTKLTCQSCETKFYDLNKFVALPNNGDLKKMKVQGTIN